jgi:hypothetical protein
VRISDLGDGLAITGALRVALRLNFANTGDRVVLRALGVDYVTPTEAASSSTGLFNVRDFGAVGDGAADDTPAFTRALAAIAAFSGRPTGDPFTPCAILSVPTGTYRLTEPLRLSHPLTLIGAGESGCELTFPAGSAGVIVDRRLADPGSPTGPWRAFATNTVISGFSITTPERFPPTGSGPVDPLGDDAHPEETASGVVLHCRARVVGCSVLGFRDDGIHINTAHGLGTNANNWYVEHCFTLQNGRHGMFVAGGDSNAGVAIGVMCQGNFRWGFFDRSFLGNTYVGCATESNGAGGYRTTNGSARHTLVGCYAEADQLTRLTYPTLIVGGNNQGREIEYDPAVRDASWIHNEGNVQFHDLHVTGPLSTNVARMSTIASGAPQDIGVQPNVVLASSNGLLLELRLPPASRIRVGHRVTVKKVDRSEFPVRLVGTEEAGTIPPIDGQPTYDLATPDARATVVFGGDGWYVVG